MSELLVDCMEPKRERAGKENISNFWTAVNLFDDGMQELYLGSVEEKEQQEEHQKHPGRSYCSLAVPTEGS